MLETKLIEKKKHSFKYFADILFLNEKWMGNDKKQVQTEPKEKWKQIWAFYTWVSKKTYKQYIYS